MTLITCPNSWRCTLLSSSKPLLGLMWSSRFMFCPSRRVVGGGKISATRCPWSLKSIEHFGVGYNVMCRTMNIIKKIALLIKSSIGTLRKEGHWNPKNLGSGHVGLFEESNPRYCLDFLWQNHLHLQSAEKDVPDYVGKQNTHKSWPT